jgi:hypothetical protein
MRYMGFAAPQPNSLVLECPHVLKTHKPNKTSPNRGLGCVLTFSARPRATQGVFEMSYVEVRID